MGIALDKINQLEVVTFDWKETGEPDISMIAEEVYKVIPEAVWIKDGKVEGLKLLTLISVIVKAVQELNNGKLG